jgi:hypothetical protein
MDPTTALGPELDALLRRLVEVDATKWHALHELGLSAAVPRKGGDAT